MANITQLQAAAPAAIESNRVLRRKAVEGLIGVSRATIYRWIADGSFPRQVSLGGRAVGWRESDIAAFLKNLKTVGA